MLVSSRNIFFGSLPGTLRKLLTGLFMAVSLATSVVMRVLGGCSSAIVMITLGLAIVHGLLNSIPPWVELVMVMITFAKARKEREKVKTEEDYDSEQYTGIMENIQ